MDLLIYLDSRVYINLKTGFYYTGKVLSADETSITILDKNGRKVAISADSILAISEVGK